MGEQYLESLKSDALRERSARDSKARVPDNEQHTEDFDEPIKRVFLVKK